MKTYEYPLPDRCCIESVTLRETFGTDEDEAVIASENNESDPKMELVALSIVAVDGKPCLPGHSGFDNWPTKTRGVVKALFNRLNDAPAKELEKLIKAAEEDGTSIVDDRVHTRYPLPEGCELKYVVFREMMEPDERAATAHGRNATEAMISSCIVETDKGEGLKMKALKALGTKTRNALSTYWGGMNFVSDEELAPLAMAAEATQDAAKKVAVPEASVASSDEESSRSGSGSQAPVDADSPSPSRTSEALAE